MSELIKPVNFEKKTTYNDLLIVYDIIDIFEEVLQENNMYIPDVDREGNEEEEACIYGYTYYMIEEKLKDLLVQYDLAKEKKNESNNETGKYSR